MSAKWVQCRVGLVVFIAGSALSGGPTSTPEDHYAAGGDQTETACQPPETVMSG